ncbi:Uncharacterised protein [Shigella sonnei]|nr:Uncharacterised protein [Shigella sonnei]
MIICIGENKFSGRYIINRHYIQDLCFIKNMKSIFPLTENLSNQRTHPFNEKYITAVYQYTFLL